MSESHRRNGWVLEEDLAEVPLLAVALHDGHEIRPELRRCLAVDSATRSREEDAFTGRWTRIAPSRIVVRISRFEIDLNRPREHGAFYLTPADAWGLRVWARRPSEAMRQRSLALHDRFYRDLRGWCDRAVSRFGRFVVYDVHSYNYRRRGPDAPAAPEAMNPEINVGTGSLQRHEWRGVVERFMADLAAFDFGDRRLDVRENVNFRGGHMCRWIHATYPGRGCSLAVEVKKFYMDEWTGIADPILLNRVRSALATTVGGVREELMAAAPFSHASPARS
jgi:N-formylglutamate amidohydrolase